ncbi:hypothetical protein GOV12_05535 [Candidatus Pacearchaeota archaeon]|nr:hypothetical protein [Candidatus Pacearchaeota archaeon]
MEKIMKWWAKITSLVIIFGVFYIIYISFSFVELYIDNQAISINEIILFVLAMNFIIIFGLIFYSPFFYYGWIKNSSNKYMKSYTKLMTIFYSVSVVFSSIFSISKLSDILIIPIALVIITPLYYYAWRK